MRVILFVLVVFFIASCKNKNDKIDLVQYRGGQQLLTMNDLQRNGQKFITPRIVRLSDDSVLVGNELLVKIFLDRGELELVDAFIDCSEVTNLAVDTSTYKISGCANGLIVQNDTIFIGFRVSKLGVQKFSEITLLTRDAEKVFRTFKYSFEYIVIAAP